ncbi:MAG TPA: AAA family ATPase [Candidatus Limnocylindrales bacterium]|nr:AAA family ATPase [Candidatus Limnocylindrales bacterium]
MSSSTRAPAGSIEATPVLEREHELDVIDAALERAQGGAGTAIVVEGEAGIGKSTLARHAIREAARRGLRVLRAQGGELERAVPYGVVIELFAALARDERQAADLFSGPAAVAAPLLGIGRAHDDAGGAGGGGNGQRPDPFAYLHGLFWLVLNLVERGPLVVVVDDAQWADEPSLRFLHRLVQRIDELPVVVVLAMRPVGDSPESAAGNRLRSLRSAAHLTPDGLTETAVGTLLSSVSGRPVDDGLRRASWEATRGNPFFVTELGSELARLDAGGSDADPGGSLIPERVGRFVESRLAAVDPAARSLAEAVAVLGESATLRRAANLARLDPATGLDAARRLAEAGILDDAAAISFRHPIVRGGVYTAIPGPVRASLHRRAALLLADGGADIGVVGTQLGEAEPSGDPRVVELLVAAADDAVARGEPAAAATLLRRALAEPPGATGRARILTLLARAEAAAGSPSAPDTYAEAMALVDDPTHRAALWLELGHALVGGSQWAAARDAFERGIAESGDLDPELRARLEAAFLSAAWVTMEDRTQINERVERILASDELGAANRELAVWIAFQQGAVVGSTAREMGDLVKRVFTEAPVEDLVRQGQAVEVGTGLLLETDDLAFEVDFLSRALAAARTTGPIGKAGIYAYCRAWPHYYMGRLTDAIADAEEALRAADLGWEAFVPAAVTVAALAHIERDELDAAAAVIAIDPAAWGGRIDTAMLLPLASGRLALARGDIPGAIGELRQAAEGAGAAFMRNSVPTEWRSWYATALVGAGRRDEARAIAADGVEVARAWGAAWPLGAALRAAGLVEGGGAGLALLHEAEALLADGPARLEHARLLVDLGAALRRNGSLTEARAVLARAADLARQIGARRLLARAATEQRAAGARPRRVALTGVDALTPAERRVAQEALAGRSNREIAQALFVTPKAVEFHLANAYRKLHIGSRGELAGVMATPDDQPGTPELAAGSRHPAGGPRSFVDPT